MPLIQPEKKVEQAWIRVKVEQPLKEKLDRYAEYLASSADHVVAQAIEYVIGKDKEFAAQEGEPKRKRRVKAAAA